MIIFQMVDRVLETFKELKSVDYKHLKCQQKYEDKGINN